MTPEVSAVELGWKVAGPIGAGFVIAVLVAIFFFRKYDAEKELRIAEMVARIADARAYGDGQRKINEEILPYVSRILKRIERFEKDYRLADSDPPGSIVSRISLQELGEETNKGQRP